MPESREAQVLEIERKYEAGDEVVLPDLPGATEPETYELTAAYYDTDDRRLARHKITLRRRTGGHDEGWHLKLPHEGERQEIQLPLAEELPDRLAFLVAGLVRDHELTEVATLTTTRTVTRLTRDGVVLAEIADDKVHAREQTWREIEVELVDGDEEILDEVGERLRAAGAHPASYASKVGRALGALPDEPTPGYGTARDVALTYLREQLATIEVYDPRVRLAEDDAVHRMRVAVRRTRSILRTYRKVLGDSAALQDELKWLADELGEVRDLEVLRERFGKRLAELGEERPPWLIGLAAREKTAYTGLYEALGDPRYFALLDALESYDPPAASGRDVSRIVAVAWRKVEDRYEAIASADDPEEARHRTRKAAKRARYTAESAVPVLGRRAKRVERQAKKLQQALGAYQDSVIAREQLASLNTGGPDAFSLGVLYGLEHHAAAQALKDTKRVWKKITR